MRYFIIICFLFVSCGHGFVAEKPFVGWTKEDTYRQVAYTALHAVDWAQTVEISRNPDKFHETNSYLGDHPSESDVHAYMASTLILQTLATGMIKPKYRKWWQYCWIGSRAAAVGNNFAIGLHGEF